MWNCGQQDLAEGAVTRAALTNLSNETVVLCRGSRVAHLRVADSTSAIFSVETRNSPSDQDIEDLYNKLLIGQKGLSSVQDQSVREMLRKCYHAFSRHGEIGEARIPPIHIEFANSQPVRCKPYRHSEADNKVIRELVDEMIHQGLVAKVDDRFASPLCLIWQKGKPRAVIDYRAVNRAVRPNQKGTILPIQTQLKKVRPNSTILCLSLI